MQIIYSCRVDIMLAGILDDQIIPMHSIFERLDIRCY